MPPTVKPSMRCALLPSTTIAAPFAAPTCAATNAAVAYLSAPPSRVTVRTPAAFKPATTFAEITDVPPTIYAVVACRATRSAITAAGNVSAAVNSSGAFEVRSQRAGSDGVRHCQTARDDNGHGRRGGGLTDGDGGAVTIRSGESGKRAEREVGDGDTLAAQQAVRRADVGVRAIDAHSVEARRGIDGDVEAVRGAIRGVERCDVTARLIGRARACGYRTYGHAN